MANKMVSCRLPAELVEAIEAQAKATGQSKTHVVIAALAKYYEWPHSLPQIVTPEQLLQQLNELKHLLEILLEANKLHQLIAGAESPIKPGSEVDKLFSSMPLEARLAWVNRVLTESAQKELELRLAPSEPQSTSRPEEPAGRPSEL